MYKVETMVICNVNYIVKESYAGIRNEPLACVVEFGYHTYDTLNGYHTPPHTRMNFNDLNRVNKGQILILTN